MLELARVIRAVVPARWLQPSPRMTAIAPPPVGSEQEPSVLADNAAALGALQAERAPTSLAIRSQPQRSPRSPLRSIGGLLGFGAATLVAAAIGGVINSRRRNKVWYRLLRKPSFTPPDKVFALVWPALYTLSAVSGWRVWKSEPSRERNVALRLWGAQLAFNGAWSWLFFGRHQPRLALADLAANYASLGAYAYTASRIDRPAALMVAPYLGWMTFAGALNASIVGKNRGPIAGLLSRG